MVVTCVNRSNVYWLNVDLILLLKAFIGVSVYHLKVSIKNCRPFLQHEKILTKYHGSREPMANMFSAFILWISFELLSTIRGQACSSKGWCSFFAICGMKGLNASFNWPCHGYIKRRNCPIEKNYY